MRSLGLCVRYVDMDVEVVRFIEESDCQQYLFIKQCEYTKYN